MLSDARATPWARVDSLPLSTPICRPASRALRARKKQRTSLREHSAALRLRHERIAPKKQIISRKETHRRGHQSPQAVPASCNDGRHPSLQISPCASAAAAVCKPVAPARSRSGGWEQQRQRRHATAAACKDSSGWWKQQQQQLQRHARAAACNKSRGLVTAATAGRSRSGGRSSRQLQRIFLSLCLQVLVSLLGVSALYFAGFCLTLLQRRRDSVTRVSVILEYQ